MARVERGNVVLHIADNEVQHYLQLGYNLTDESGNVISSAIPSNLGVLQKYYVEHTEKIEELEKTITTLTAQLNQPKKSTKKTKE